jgi:hypothetical protein
MSKIMEADAAAQRSVHSTQSPVNPRWLVSSVVTGGGGGAGGRRAGPPPPPPAGRRKCWQGGEVALANQRRH